MSLTAKPRPSSQSRKRQAGHHRHSKSYLKAYWPYLPMAAIVISGVFVNSLLSTGEGVLGWQSNFSSSSLLSLINTDRLNNDEAALSLNQQLTSAAEAKASDMASKNYWSHTASDGKTAANFIVASGYQYAVAGENLAYGFNSASSVNSAWMNSAKHRANILNRAYTNVGFGVAESPNYLNQGPKVIVVAEYGQPSGSGVLGLVNQPPLKSVSTLDRLTGTNASWSEIALSIILTAAVVSFIFKHCLSIRKFIFSSEDFIIKHPVVDISLVFLATAAAILGHTSGIIG